MKEQNVSTPLRALRKRVSCGKLDMTFMTSLVYTGQVPASGSVDVVSRLMRHGKSGETGVGETVKSPKAHGCKGSAAPRPGESRKALVRDSTSLGRPSAGTRHCEHWPADQGIPAVARHGRQMRAAS